MGHKLKDPRLFRSTFVLECASSQHPATPSPSRSHRIDDKRHFQAVLDLQKDVRVTEISMASDFERGRPIFDALGSPKSAPIRSLRPVSGGVGGDPAKFAYSFPTAGRI